MADEQLYHGIISFEVLDNGADQKLARLVQSIQQHAATLGQINISSGMGASLAQDINKGEISVERLMQSLLELKAAFGAGGQGNQWADEARSVDALINKVEQLKRVQAMPARVAEGHDPSVVESEVRARNAADNARLRAEAYGGGIAGARKGDQVATAQTQVRGADAELTKAQRDLTEAMQERLRHSETVKAAEDRLAAAERELAEAARKREAGMERQREYNERPGARFREVRPGAADELALQAAARQVVAARTDLAEQTNVEKALGNRVIDSQEKVALAAERRANAEVRAALVTESATEKPGAVNISEAERRIAEMEYSSGEEVRRRKANAVIAEDNLAAARQAEKVGGATFANDPLAQQNLIKAIAANEAAQLALKKATEDHAKAQAKAAASTEQGRVNIAEAERQIRNMRPTGHDPVRQAQADAVTARDNLAAAERAKRVGGDTFKNDPLAMDNYYRAVKINEAAQGRLTRAIDERAKAEAKAAAAAEKEAQQELMEGDPRRAQLMEPDSRRFLQSQGIDLSQSVRQQELSIERARLAAAKEGLLAKAEAVDNEKDLAILLQQREQVERRLLANAAASERQRFMETGRGGFAGGMLGNFSGSPDGVRGSDIAFQAGQAFKYFALYSAMTAAMQAMSGLVSISAEYSLAVTDLAVAMGVSNEEAKEAATVYANIGAELGTGPVEALQGASKFRRTFRDPATQESEPGAGRVGATIASYVNILEGPERIDRVMQDMISLMRAYGQPASGAEGVYDQAQFISQRFGYQSGEVVGGAAALADLGKESGYDLPELVALIASVMQQTGTTSDAAAGDVKRILGSQDSPEMMRAFEKYGVDLDLNFAQKMDRLSQIIERMNPTDRSRAITDLSADPRTGAVRAAMISAAPGARAAAAGAENADGLVGDQVQQRLGELGGELKQLTANLTQMALALGDVGIVPILTRMLHAFNGLAGGITELANMLDIVPDPLKQLVIGLLALFAAVRAFAAVRGVMAGSTLLSGLAGGNIGGESMARLQTQRSLALASGNTALAASFQPLIAAEQAAIASTTTLTGRMVAMGRSMAGAIGPMIILAGVLAAFTIIGDGLEKKKSGEGAAKKAIDADKALDKMGTDSAPEAIKAQMEALKESSKEIDATKSGVTGWLMDFATRSQEGGGLAGARERALAAIKGRLAEAQKLLDAIDTQIAETDFEKGGDSAQRALFGDEFQRVTYGIEKIKARGLSATAGTNSLEYLVKNADLEKLFPTSPDEKGAPDLIKTIEDVIGRGTSPTKRATEYGQLRQIVAQLQARAQEDPNQTDAANVLMEQANSAYLDALVNVTEARIANIKATQSEGPKAKGAITKLIRAALTESSSAGDVEQTVALLSTVDEAFLRSYTNIIRGQLAAQKHALETLKKALLINAAAAAAAREAAGGATDHFTRMEDSDPDKDAREAIEKKIAGLNKQLGTLEEAGTLATFSNSAFEWPKDKGDDPKDVEAARIAAMARPGDAVQNATIGLKLAKYQFGNAEEGTVEYWNAYKAVKDAQFQLAQSVVERTNAVIGANAVSGDSYSQAVAGLAQAKNVLNASVKGSTAYYQALAGLHDAQYALGSAQLEAANQARTLASDVTNPVEQARIAVQAAKDKLAYDKRRGASSQTITADQAALKQAQASAASSAWSQQFGDMQTNYDLNRISLSAYLKYLNSQKAYLEAVKNKTRDQVEQLNQVDQALQSLTESLEGQWNLGDIKVPTAYEMRRAQAGAGGATVNNIEINGANMEQVMSLLQSVLGVATVQSAATVPAKV